MNPTIFKSYDIRALCPQEFHPEDAERIARSLAKEYPLKRVLVGRDMRETSLPLEEALVRGFTASGVNVTLIGLCSTPMFNFAMGETPGTYDLGLMVTASHNPAAYNGIKLVNRELQPIGLGSGLERLRDLAVSDEQFIDSNNKGQQIQDETVQKRYLDRVFSLVELGYALDGKKIVIDAGNGMAGILLPEIAKRLPTLTLEPLYWELDGNFPNHEANPLKAETLTVLKQHVRDQKAICGFAFDGDADRIGVVDEQGEQIPGDLLIALLARELLRHDPQLSMVYDLRASRVVGEIVAKGGGVSEKVRVGRAHIIRRMNEIGARFGGELSMHFYFAPFNNCESGDYVLLLVLELLAREQKPLSVLWHDLQRYSQSGERNFHVADTAEVLARVREVWSALPEAELLLIDGIRVDQWQGTPEDWWCSIRASNTEPLLRVNVETRDQALLPQKFAEIEAMLRSIDPSLTPAH